MRRVLVVTMAVLCVGLLTGGAWWVRTLDRGLESARGEVSALEEDVRALRSVEPAPVFDDSELRALVAGVRAELEAEDEVLREAVEAVNDRVSGLPAPESLRPLVVCVNDNFAEIERETGDFPSGFGIQLRLCPGGF